ncbi:cupin domain-containing protein [Marinomonas mediterranea]|jgi:Cupin domain.|uniref:Cupin 2 conserved barrel domain protein n=1 Tax=Marinomonas mediterranea (strain ATCC 700492 / JCM 21426 / NBRC 103028 / MMB-1) TaxID=717774 RepID=F2K4S2_MARM1|nr:cupin domain-containing protein [Marinomonas mediterranea]ADZ91465.1 Cupin 2 conserved barrel domain protein [Marinomonas mediterranea MMB-1]WCN09432.1 cupin domain-containing protein [Marinomonas mediterranea]WCN17574.1 cupin domain-containing protein [Marinomonas mediterranea MMB-1]
MTLPTTHRVITGHDEEGNAIIVENGPIPTTMDFDAIPGTKFHEIWNTTETPSLINLDDQDPTLGPVVLSPPKNGTRIRFVDIPPDTEEFLTQGKDKMEGVFSSIGSSEFSTVKENSPHPLMHRTESVDYGIVLEGELTLIVDDGEALLKPGSVVIQRGTNHAWANKSNKMCRIVFILVDACYDAELDKALTANN